MADGAAAPEEEVTFEGGDQLQELLSAADFADAGRSSGRRAKSKAKAKARAKAAADGEGEGRVLGVPAPRKAPGRETYRGLKCMICQCDDCVGKNPYCQKCKADVDSLAKTASEDGWLEKFTEAKKSERTFRKLVRDYQSESPSKGKGRPRVRYSKSRALEIIANEYISDEGSRMVKMDWFDFETHYQKKRLDQSEIEKKWRTRLAAEGAFDMEGDNEAYPERLLVKCEDYVDSKNRRRVTHEVQRENSAKQLVKDDAAAQAFLSEQGDARPAGFFSSSAEETFKARPRRRSVGSNGSLSSVPGAEEEKDKAVGGDLTVARLKAFDETGEQIKKFQSTLSAAIAKVETEALGSVARVSDYRIGWLILISHKLATGSPTR